MTAMSSLHHIQLFSVLYGQLFQYMIYNICCAKIYNTPAIYTWGCACHTLYIVLPKSIDYANNSVKPNVFLKKNVSEQSMCLDNDTRVFIITVHMWSWWGRWQITG